MDLLLLIFDSGRSIKDNFLFTSNNGIEASPTASRNVYEFKDRLGNREFDVEIIFDADRIDGVFIYPKDLNSGGYETPREIMEKNVPILSNWFEKNIVSQNRAECSFESEFDPRSWSVYLVIESKGN